MASAPTVESAMGLSRLWVARGHRRLMNPLVLPEWQRRHYKIIRMEPCGETWQTHVDGQTPLINQQGDKAKHKKSKPVIGTGARGNVSVV